MKNNTDLLEIKIDENKHLLPYDYYSTVVEHGRLMSFFIGIQK